MENTSKSGPRRHPGLWTLTEVAELLGVHLNTIHYHVHTSKKLPKPAVGEKRKRYDIKGLVEFVEKFALLRLRVV